MYVECKNRTTVLLCRSSMAFANGCSLFGELHLPASVLFRVSPHYNGAMTLFTTDKQSRAILKIGAFVFLGLIAANADATSALCTSAETTFFSCETRQHKTIALCGGSNQALQYRFGTPQRVELRYPSQGPGNAAVFAYANYFRPLTTRTEVTFRNENSSYTVFDYREDDGKRYAGVQASFANGAKDIQLLCAGSTRSRLWQLQDVVPCDADNALNFGGCPVR